MDTSLPMRVDLWRAARLAGIELRHNVHPGCPICGSHRLTSYERCRSKLTVRLAPIFWVAYRVTRTSDRAVKSRSGLDGELDTILMVMLVTAAPEASIRCQPREFVSSVAAKRRSSR